jgi:integrase
MRVDNTESRLDRIASDCAFRRLADLNGTALERWLSARQAEGMGAVTRSGHREVWVTFANWCVRNGRLLSNPFAGVPKADGKADPRRKRRALTEDELRRLLDVARRRPLLDASTVRRGKRQGETDAKLSEPTRRRLERLGHERALIYKALVLTGLRKGELASLTVRQLFLDAPLPYLVLDAADEKNREGNSIPLRADLAEDLRQWLAEKANAARDDARDVPTVAIDLDTASRQSVTEAKGKALPGTP